MEENSISCIVTDPPYGLSFMGKGWDHEVPGTQYWRECFRVLKPGGHILAFGSTRTFHRLACAIEDSEFEIRDTIMWIYGSGFPKSHNNYGIPAFGTALKPAYEPIIMAMKPCEGTFKQNAEKWGQAGINIDECRIGIQGGTRKENTKKTDSISCFGTGLNGGEVKVINKGRWPANVIFDEEAGKMLDEQSGQSKSSPDYRCNDKVNSIYQGGFKRTPNFVNDAGGASRFFYCAKTSSKERNEGLEGMQLKEFRPLGISNWEGQTNGNGEIMGKSAPQKNHHPTVKPLKLMQYLIKLVMPPKDGVLLDPFAGSGSTIIAAHKLGVKAIGIEKSEEYCEIARKRLEYAEKEVELKEPDLFGT